MCRAGAELVYHRLPWREPDAPYLLEVLFEDDYLVIKFEVIFVINVYTLFMR